MNDNKDFDRKSNRPHPKESKKTKEKRKKVIITTSLIVIMLSLVVIAFLVIRSSNGNRSTLLQDNENSITSITETASLPEIYKNNEIIGTWRYDEYNQYTFYSDGRGYLLADDVTYDYSFTLNIDKLLIDFDKDVVRDCEYQYHIDDIHLTLIGGTGTDGGTYNLTKEK